MKYLKLFLSFCLIISTSNSFSQEDTITDFFQNDTLSLRQLDSSRKVRDSIEKALFDSFSSAIAKKVGENANRGNISSSLITGIAFPLIVGLLIALFEWRLVRVKKETRRNVAKEVKSEFLSKYIRRMEAAPTIYVGSLDKLIKQAHAEGAEFAIINARAIVEARNGLIETLTSIASNLNSQIDYLGAQVGITPRKSTPSNTIMNIPVNDMSNPESVYTTIQVLHKIWDSRKLLIEVQVNKMITEMGFRELINEFENEAQQHS